MQSTGRGLAHGVWSFLCFAALGGTLLAGAGGAAQEPPAAPAGGEASLATSALKLTLVRGSQTVAALSPSAEPTIDYSQGDRLAERAGDGFYQLGDLDLRLRVGEAGPWQDYSTAAHREPVRPMVVDATHVSADLGPTLPAGIPLRVTRSWSTAGDRLGLQFRLTNPGSQAVHLGGVGIAMVFNNNWNGRTLDQAYARCSFYDPSISEDGGYVQVVRLTGTGPVLLVVPDGQTPLEAWKPILDERAAGAHGKHDGPALPGNDRTPRGITYEGSFDWMVHSAGFGQEWARGAQWNPETEAVLGPGESVTYGLRFLVAPSVRAVEATLAAAQRPVAVGVPGYILPQDMEGRLFLKYASPVRSVRAEPGGALRVVDDGAQNAWHAYTVRGVQWGRARLVIRYADGAEQSIAYRTTKPEARAVADLGRFLFDRQWFTDENDPFHRAPSVISYDDEAGRQVTEEPRVWIAGLSDEAGAGSWLAAAMKESIAPDAGEIHKLDAFIDGVLWGHLQVSAGPEKYGVHKSLFFYQPELVPKYVYDPAKNWTSWASWNRKAADDLGRSFNYPHVTAAYWSLYRVARVAPERVTAHAWEWYLGQAYETILAMDRLAPYYTQFGQMEGTVFVRVLEALKAEGWTAQAATLEGEMRRRAEHWQAERYPFGSEMPWDSTGQEEVYAWSRYFGFADKAAVTLNAVLAYTPVVPSWGYNGSARRYWDFLYGGKYQRIERQLHHYGSGINAIPLLAEYRLHPEDLYLLRAGYAGSMGPLANIDEKGFASAAFHSFPDRMAYDPYSGDYGPNFFGHAMNTATYLVHDSDLGWLCFGGNLTHAGNSVGCRTMDSARSRIYVAPAGVWLTLDAGQFTGFDYDRGQRRIRLHLSPASRFADAALLRVEQTAAAGDGVHYNRVAGKTEQVRGAIRLPLGKQETTYALIP